MAKYKEEAMFLILSAAILIATYLPSLGVIRILAGILIIPFLGKLVYKIFRKDRDYLMSYSFSILFGVAMPIFSLLILNFLFNIKISFIIIWMTMFCLGLLAIMIRFLKIALLKKKR
ncbi:MAG: hypothetical protein AABX51_07450 [Nanoarchaeota archaeon]